MGHCLRDVNVRRRRYVRADEVENLACNKYKENGRGITIDDLLTNGLALHKKQAQTNLKYCLRRGILFTVYNCKPQQYYPSCLRSEIMKAKTSKNIPIYPTGANKVTARQTFKRAFPYRSVFGRLCPSNATKGSTFHP